jgi:tRNA A-37 threonylcarbamoyl transferase component Bud32
MRALAAGLQLREYCLEHRIGRGGEGDVWMALDLDGKAVALKARPHTDDQDAQRFRSEFTRLRTLQLPNVVRVLDVGADQGYLFFTMEVAHGVPFHAFSEASHSKKEQITRVCAAAAQVARALASIHRLGLAHRDIKPANIHVREDLVSREVHAIVLDFGTHHFGATQDESAPLFGSVPYMAPEQRLGMPHDHHVDLYSLGTVLHEALTGTKAQHYSPGQRRASLVGLGPHIPLHLADLIDRLLDLDPSDRPSAEEAEAVLHGIAMNLHTTPCAWPKPVVAGGAINPLMEGNRMVVGSLGDGVGRHIANARWHWYRKGYLSVMGRCEPSRPYAPFQAILAQLFHQRGTADRVVLAGPELAVLHGIWPEIPLPCEQPMTHAPPPTQAADALAAVFNRCSPIALIVHHVHKADPGTAKTLPLLMDKLDLRNRLWSSSTKEHPDIEWVRPPKWTRKMHEAAWAELVGADAPIPDPTPNGRDFLKLAWTELGSRKEATPIPQPIPESLCRLSILRSPFPHSVAVQIAPDLDLWIDCGYLEIVAPATADASARLRFVSEATRTLAEAELTMTLQAHTLAAIAWGRFPEDDEAVRARTLHLLLAGTVQSSDLTSAIQLEVTRERPGQVRRWMDLLRLHVGEATMQASDRAYEYHYAQCYTQLHIAPATITLDDVRELAAEADTVLRRGLAAHFKLAHAIRTGESEWVISEGRRWATSLSVSHPVLAARMLREIALADLGTKDNEQPPSSRRCRSILVG